MRQGIWRGSPALAVAILALFVALGGSVYAAKRAKIDGRAIRTKSIPGDRLKPRSIAANRLKPGALRAAIPTPLTGVDINELTLAQVPDAAHADIADLAQSAVDAQTALNAVNAIDAKTVNGHGVGCLPGTREFAGACWEATSSSAVNAPTAARKCAARGATLPEALELAAFAEEPGVNLAAGNEWSSDVTNVSGLNVYGVVTVSTGSGVNSDISTDTHAYRCVIPLVT
jgi:sugar phosphate isomerase/epimerase